MFGLKKPDFNILGLFPHSCHMEIEFTFCVCFQPNVISSVLLYLKYIYFPFLVFTVIMALPKTFPMFFP